jgi:hypothetical protein
MATLQLLLSLLLGLNYALTGARGQVTPVCDPSAYSDPSTPVPTLPSQFSTVVEANLLNSNEEVIVREYFDEIKNRGRLELTTPRYDGYALFDYDLQEIFLLPDFDTEEDCVVRKIAQSDTFVMNTFGFRLQNGSVHIGTVSDYFQLANTSAILYLGEESVRGIPCNHWQTCTVSNNGSYLIDYYFSRADTNWTSAFNDDPVPVQITVSGNLFKQGLERNITNIYTFIAFNAGPDSVPDEVFRPPTGVSCKGQTPGQPLPLLPNYFSTYIEAVNEDEQTVNIVRDFYDLEFKFFRTDSYNDGQYGLPEGPFTFIQDFNLETQYLINRQHRNCSISLITEANFDTVVVDGVPTLATPAQLFLLTDEFNYSYEGVSTVRGVEVDSWISYREFEQLATANLSNFFYEIFFTRPEWTLETLTSASSSKPTLWQMKVMGTITFINESTNLTQTQNFSSTYDFFGFNNGEPDLDVFDTSVCVPPSEYYTVTLYLPVDNVQVDFLQLYRNVRRGLARFTDLEPLQIGNIQVTGSNATVLFLSLHISNLSAISLPQDNSPVSAYQAVEKLTSSASTNNDKLDFPIEIATGRSVSPTLVFIRSENGTVYHAGAFRSDEEEDSMLSDGAIAGIAIWMLVVGVGLGIMGTLIVQAVIGRMRTKSTINLGKTSAVSYERQKDDTETITVTSD